MKKLTIEIFDEKEITFSSETEAGGGGSPLNPTEPSTDCSGVKHFTNEGLVEVEHTCDSIYLDIEVYNSATGKEVGAVKKIINNNKFTVTMSPSIDGYIVWEKIR